MKLSGIDAAVQQLGFAIAEAVAQQIQRGVLVDRVTAAKMLSIGVSTFDTLHVPKIKLGDGEKSAARYRISDIEELIERRRLNKGTIEQETGKEDGGKEERGSDLREMQVLQGADAGMWE